MLFVFCAATIAFAGPARAKERGGDDELKKLAKSYVEKSAALSSKEFIHAKADYSEFLPAAIKKGVGLIAIKPLAAGSIVKLDPKARQGSRPEQERVMLYQKQDRPLLPAVVAQLTKDLGQRRIGDLTGAGRR